MSVSDSGGYINCWSSQHLELETSVRQQVPLRQYFQARLTGTRKEAEGKGKIAEELVKNG